MRKQRTKSMLLILCALPLALSGCGLSYSVRHQGYHHHHYLCTFTTFTTTSTTNHCL